MKFDLGFGNAVVVRESFLETYQGNLIVFTPEGLSKFNYPPYLGDPELLEITRNIIQRQTRRKYKHVALVNGATGGVAISLRSYALNDNAVCCVTRPAPWYLKYPEIIAAAGLVHKSDAAWPKEPILLDFPSNPLASIEPIHRPVTCPLIIDGVYYNNVYRNVFFPLPEHDILIGSYSKLLGLNGIRVGWIATNSDEKFEQIEKLITAEYCGLSVASSEILQTTLFNFDWDQFEKSAHFKLNDNREEFAKLEKYIGYEVPEIGMFLYGHTDSKFREILEKANVIWTKGSVLGTNDDFGRFNMAQNRKLVRHAIQAILKADEI